MGLGHDGRLIFATRAVRMFGHGLVSVVLVLYLAVLGLSGQLIGALLTLTLLGDAAISLWLTTHAGRVGRRRVLIVGALLMCLEVWVRRHALSAARPSPGGDRRRDQPERQRGRPLPRRRAGGLLADGARARAYPGRPLRVERAAVRRTCHCGPLASNRKDLLLDTAELAPIRRTNKGLAYDRPSLSDQDEEADTYACVRKSRSSRRLSRRSQAWPPARRLGIDQVAAQVLPADKQAAVARFQEGGRHVAMGLVDRRQRHRDPPRGGHPGTDWCDAPDGCRRRRDERLHDHRRATRAAPRGPRLRDWHAIPARTPRAAALAES